MFLCTFLHKVRGNSWYFYEFPWFTSANGIGQIRRCRSDCSGEVVACVTDQGTKLTNEKDRAPRPKQRPIVLAERRNAKMARSAHAYMRGNTVKFYEWLVTAAGKSYLTDRRYGSVAIAMSATWVRWRIWMGG